MEAFVITKAQKSMTSLQQCDHEYVPEGQTINNEYYLEVLHCLCDAVQRKWLDMGTGKNWQLHHDNVSTYSAHVVKGFLAKNNMALVQQPSHSPDLAPCNF